MSIYVDMHINDEPIGSLGSIGITRTTEHGSQPGSVNTYRWVIYRNRGRRTVGFVDHRYGDGAIALVHKVLGDMLERDA